MLVFPGRLQLQNSTKCHSFMFDALHWRRVWPSGQLLEYRGSSFARRVVSLGKELHYPFFHCSSRCINGTGDIQLAGNPEMDQHPVQRGEAILLNMLHAEETGLTSNRLHLWLVCALTLRYLQWSLHDKLTKGYFIRIQCQISQRYIY